MIFFNYLKPVETILPAGLQVPAHNPTVDGEGAVGTRGARATLTRGDVAVS